MKILKYAGLMLLLLVYTLKGESEVETKWKERKELLMKDASVSRYYTFEEVTDSKSIVKDLTGKGNDLSFMPAKAGKRIVDDLKVVDGRFPGKKAVRLDRGHYQGPAVDIPNKSFTAECWFRLSGPVTQYEEIKSNVNSVLLSGAGGRGWILGADHGRVSSIPGTTSDGKKNVYYQATARKTSIPERVWQHIAFTWNGQEVIFYLNGQIAAKIKHDGDYNLANYPFRVGLNTREILDIDEVIIHNRVLSSEEIKEAGSGVEGFALNTIKAIFETADSLIQKKDFNGARKEYIKIKDISDINYGEALSLFNIAESYRLEKKYDLANKTFLEILKISSLTPHYRAYTLFTQAELYNQQNKYNESRKVYQQILKTPEISENDTMRAEIGIGDTYRGEKKYIIAKGIYEKLLKDVSSKYNPNEIDRLKLVDRLESIDGLKDGQTEITDREKRINWVNLPTNSIYVSPDGKDTNKGSKDSPFATIERAQQELRKIKTEGFPQKGISVYLRGGEYFIEDTITFSEEDSGTDSAPVVFRAYQGEVPRIIGGKRVKDFKPVTDKKILDRLPVTARNKVFVADLSQQGINNYGVLKNRGTGTEQSGAMELIYNGEIMQMARWPNEGWARVASLVDPKGDYTFRDEPYQKGKFKYSGNQPERWTEEKDAWLRGYLGPKVPYVINHLKITSIDTKEKIIYLADDPRTAHVKDPAYVGNRISRGTPFFAYNLLSEIDTPGEWYIDKDTGKLYFFPPKDIKGEAIVTTLDKPIIELKNASNLVLYGVTLEGTWQNGILVSAGHNALIAGCVVKNIGQSGIYLKSGWNHSIVGCDIYDVGDAGIILADNTQYNFGYAQAIENRRKLIPTGFCVENNFIARVNRLSGSSMAVQIRGIGQKVKHNIITDSNHSAISIYGNNNIVEYNDIHDVVAHSRELGAIYTWDLGQPLTFRGNIIKNNFVHHITGHYSPNQTHGVRAVHIDGLSSNLSVCGNIFYRTNGISSSAPDCRFENNIFASCFPGISLGNRSNLMEANGKLTTRGNRLITVMRKFESKTPPWNERYPQLSDLLNQDKRPLGWPRNITLARNINTGGPFVTFASGIRQDNTISDNQDEIDPIFHNIKRYDFRMRQGSPVYNQISFEPIPFEKIGLYKDELRATWPVEREIGKYFDSSKETTGATKPKEHTVTKRTNPIKIDGKLQKEEWLNLDKSKAIVIDKFYTRDQTEEAICKSYAWIVYDNQYLYVGIEHTPDPWNDSMSPSLKNLPIEWGMTEISVEGRADSDTGGWWLPDMETGPIYIFTGHPNGQLSIIDSYFKLPENLRNEFAKKIEYAAVMNDINTYSWSAEFKIPLNLINLKPVEDKSTRFNIGVRRRKNWTGWMYTDGRIWRLEGGGKLNFIK